MNTASLRTADGAAAPLLEINGLSKSFGSFQALRNVHLSMQPGEIISVLGPSGCGKSTLLQLIAGLSQPDAGELRLDGQVIASARRMAPPEKRGVNMVFQDYALWPHLNVADNIGYGLKRMKLSAEESAQRVKELMVMLHLEGLEKRLPPQLSGGQQQRVAIARALATRPRLMLLDEPLSNLDMRLRIEMRTEMAYLFRRLGISVFHVTHDPDEAFAMADRLLIMRAGEVDQLGTPEQVFSRPASRWSASLLGAINALQGTIVNTPNGSAIRIGSDLIHGIAGQGRTNGRYPDDTSAVLMFRPEQLQIAARRQDELPELAHNKAWINTGQRGGVWEHAEKQGAGSSYSEQEAGFSGNKLTLKVLHCTFEGVRWRAVAETNCNQKLYIILERPLAVGDVIAAKLAVEAAYLYSHEEER